MEDCCSKILGKENILFDLPSLHPVLGGGNDTEDVIIAAACAHQQVLMQDILSKRLNGKFGAKFVRGTFGQRAIETGSFFVAYYINQITFFCVVKSAFSFANFLLSCRHFEREHA